MFVIQAEVLIWLRPRKSKNPLRPQPGDIIAVRPPGHAWGKAEGPPDFAVVRVHDITAAKMAFLSTPEFNLPRTPANENLITIIRPHAHSMDLDDPTKVTSLQKAELDAGQTTMTKAEAQNAIRQTKDDGTVLSLTASLSRGARAGLSTLRFNVVTRPAAAIRRALP
jgi:hypothetical protein